MDWKNVVLKLEISKTWSRFRPSGITGEKLGKFTTTEIGKRTRDKKEWGLKYVFRSFWICDPETGIRF